MPILKDARRERFAQLVAAGSTAIDAYRNSGYNSETPGGLSTSSGRLARTPIVKARIEELRAIHEKAVVKATEKAVEKTAAKDIEKVRLTKQWVLDKLVKNAQLAMREEEHVEGKGPSKYDGSVANRALELLGKELGMFVDRKETGAPGEFSDYDATGLRKALLDRLAVARQSEPPSPVSRREGDDGGEPSRVH